VARAKLVGNFSTFPQCISTKASEQVKTRKVNLSSESKHLGVFRKQKISEEQVRYKVCGTINLASKEE